MVIAVDFDGTIVTHAYPDVGSQIGRSVEILKHFKNDMHCRLILWTCREPGYGLEQAVSFCADRGLVFDAVNSNIFDFGFFAAHKVCADVYIDDRSLSRVVSGNFGSMTHEEWDNIEKVIETIHQATSENV